MGVLSNFKYNLILTGCNYIFPLITYPYISRVLGVNNIGICGTVDSIINYFILFSMMGIGSLGVREIARHSNEKEKLSQIFSSLFSANLTLVIFASVTLVVCTLFVPFFAPYKPFLGIGLIKLIFNIFLIEWFFQGIQDFKYITTISVLLRAIYIVAIFLFVHEASDTLTYYLITVLLTMVNALINWFHSRKYCRFRFVDSHPTLYIKPIFSFGYYKILTSFYTTFNVLFLGIITNDTEVGYYTTASKINGILLSLFTAFTTVMVPKIAQLMKEGDHTKLDDIANKTADVLMALSIPIICFCLICAPQIIRIISGAGYEPAGRPFQIMISLILVIGLEQIIIQQFLMATDSNKAITIVSTVGAVVGLSLNIFLTPRLASIGTSIAWGVSELCVLVAGLILLKKVSGLTIHLDIVRKNLATAIVYLLPILLNTLEINEWVTFGITSTYIIITFLIINLKVSRNEFLLSTLKTMIHRSNKP